MSIREQHALFRQLIHVWRLGLGVALERVCPVIQIIDGDEEDVGLCGTVRGYCAEKKQRQSEDCGILLNLHLTLNLDLSS